ncbi:hypothetical protein ILUMI_00012, partial [Ignelater luminosus]
MIKTLCGHNTLEDKPKPGREKGSANPEVDKKIVTLLKKNCSMSTREIAKKVHKKPKRTEMQLKQAKTRARKLYEYFVENPEQSVLMDDETYMKMDTRTLPVLQFYTATEAENVKELNKTICVGKFDEK